MTTITFQAPIKIRDAYRVRLKTPVQLILAASLTEASFSTEGVAHLELRLDEENVAAVQRLDARLLLAIQGKTTSWFNIELSEEEIALMAKSTLKNRSSSSSSASSAGSAGSAGDDEVDEATGADEATSADEATGDDEVDEATGSTDAAPFNIISFNIKMAGKSPVTTRVLMNGEEYELLDLERLYLPKPVSVELQLVAVKFYATHFEPIWSLEIINTTPLQIEPTGQDQDQAEPLNIDRHLIERQLSIQLMERERQDAEEVETLHATIEALKVQTNGLKARFEALRLLGGKDWLKQLNGLQLDLTDLDSANSEE